MTMKITKSHTKEDHNPFGGTLYESDFDTTYSGTHNIASRIAADMKFDQMCKKNYQTKTRKKGE